MMRGDCGCRNRKGTQKQKYPSYDAALHAGMTRRLRQNGSFRVYPCPKMPEVWHLTLRPDRSRLHGVNRTGRRS